METQYPIIPFILGMTIELRYTDFSWVVSQIFAFIALVFMVWSFQERKKLKVMLLLGFGTFFLALSAFPLGNYTLASLFLLASIRNYVFWFFDWQGEKGKVIGRKNYYLYAIFFTLATIGYTAALSYQQEIAGMYWWRILLLFLTMVALIVVTAYFLYSDWRLGEDVDQVPRRIYYAFAIIFSSATVASTILLGHLGMAWWLEWLICVTLVGLIIGNVLRGQNVMRLSFVANRVFNIFNHVHFNNPIAVIIAVLAIGSNGVYYLRLLIEYLRKPDGPQASEV